MNKKIYIAVGALALILAGILLIAVQRKKGTTQPEAAAESAAASAQTQKKERTATMIWWGAYDLEINSGGTRMLLNPYKNFYRKGDYIVSSMNDKTSANSAMIEMIAQVSPDLKAIILQQRRADAKQQDNIVFDPNYPALSAKLKPLCKVLEVGGTYEDANLAVTAIPVDMGENVLLIKDKNSGLRFVYAATVESEPTKGVAKALELAKEPVDYLFADLTRFPQNEIRRILYESHPKYLVPLAYP
ncbi:MAG: hypothetical protein GX410_05135, partial [Elusimicrobia bacterium]|nr:hypothetical protein [Elusimicrobiota bacterium]